MTEPQTSLLTTTSLTGIDRLRASMTPAERASGRFMRAPDHGEDGGDQSGSDQSGDADKGDADAGDQAAADKADDDAGAGDKSLMDAGDEDGDSKEGDDDADKDGEKKDEAAEGPPEKYELTAPEGFEIDDKLLAEADPVFREIGLTGEQANKLMPLVPKFAEALFAKQNDAFQAQATDWAKTAKADKEIGGKNWAETESLVAKALDTFGAPKEFRELLNVTKLGNHPEMIRMFRKIGAATGEGGSLARTDAAAPVKAAREEVLYPNDVPKQTA